MLNSCRSRRFVRMCIAHAFARIALSVLLGVALVSCGDSDSGSLQTPSYLKAQGKAMPPGFDFGLLDHRGEFHKLSRYGDAEAIVLMSHGLGCPIVQQSATDLRALRQRYAAEQVPVFLLNPFVQDSRDEVLAELADYDLQLPVLMDESQFVAHSFGFTRTAEVIVIDPKQWQVVYRGPINDRLDYEIQKNTVEHHYLHDFLDQMLTGTTPAPVEIPFQGCAITYDKAYQQGDLTYTGKMADLLARRCLKCHREGGVAPWAMTDYQTVKNWSFMMREAVKTGRMPPWHADDAHREIANRIGLVAAEKRDLLLWLEAGAPRGEGEDPLIEASQQAAVDAQAWVLDEEPGAVYRTKAHAVPATGTLPYQYVTIDLQNETDLYVKAVHLRPLNDRVVHHSFAFVIPPAEFQKKQKAPLTNDWKSGAFATYAPGIYGEVNPADIVRFIPAHSKLKFEIHYSPSGKPEQGGVELGLFFTEPKVSDRHYRMEGIYKQWLRIPAGYDNWPATASRTFDEDIILYELMPHMHYRGKTMRYTLISPEGEEETLLSVPRFDFNWQRQYRLQEPLHIAAGSTIRVDGSFDNSILNRYNPDPAVSVGFGEQTSDEMFIGYITYAIEE